MFNKHAKPDIADKTIFLQEFRNQQVGLITDDGCVVTATFLHYHGTEMLLVFGSNQPFTLSPKSFHRIVGVKYQYSLS